MKKIRDYMAMLKLTYTTIPLWFLYTIFNSILGVVCSILGSIVLIDVVLTGISQNKSFIEIIIPVLFIQLVIILGGISTSIYYGKIDPIAKQILNKKITTQLIENAMTTELKNLDNSEYLNALSFSISQVEKRTTGSVYLISNTISSIVGLIFSLSFIGFFSVDVATLMSVVVAISFILNRLLIKVQFNYDVDKSLPERKKKYVERLYYMKKYALEIRLYPIKKVIDNVYNGAVKDIKALIRKYGFKIGLLIFVRSYLQEIVLYWGAMAILLYKLFFGKVALKPVSVIPITIAIYGLSNYILSLSGFLADRSGSDQRDPLQ